MSERRQADDSTGIYAEDVSRVYHRVAREEPAPELDAAIQTAATRAIGARRRAPSRASGRWWGVPIAVAATLVIGVSIAYLALEQPEPPLAPAPPDAALTRAAQPNEALSPGASRSGADAPTSAERAAQAGRAAAGGGSSGSPPVAATREARPGRERTPRDQPAQPRQAPAAQSVGAPEPEKGIPKRASASPLTEEMESLSPEVWLQRIRELRAKGDPVQAEAGLRAFRRRYPDYPLPADLLGPAEIDK